MSNYRKTIAALCLLALAVPSSFAQKPRMQSKAQSMYTSSIEFVDLPNSEYDPSFNKASFKEMVVNTLARSGVELDEKKRGKFHLIFEADYARRVGDVDYRFLTVRISNRNVQKHSICDVSQTVWWGGPSGAREIPGVAQSSIDAFLKRCISK